MKTELENCNNIILDKEHVMWIGIIIVELTGVVFIILAKKISDGKIELIHDYHWKNVW